MSEDPNANPTNPNPNADPGSGGDLVLDEVVGLEADKLDDTQKQFLQDHQEELTDEQREKFGIKEDNIPIDPKDIEVPSRFKIKKTKKADPDPNDEIDPEDEKNISKVVDKKTADLRKVQRQMTDEREVDGYLASNPSFTKYRAVALKYMASQAWQNVPAEAVFAYLGRNDLMKIGAQKEREAQKKANETKGGGSTSRTPAPKTDWANVPIGEMDQHINKAKGQA